MEWFLQQPVVYTLADWMCLFVCVCVWIACWLRIFMVKDGKMKINQVRKIEFISVTGNRNVLMWKKAFQLFYIEMWRGTKNQTKKNESYFSPKNLFMIDCNSNNFRGFFVSLHQVIFKGMLGKTTFIIISDQITVWLKLSLIWRTKASILHNKI